MVKETNINLRNFRLWVRDPVRRLLKEKHAGFALAMISFPVLERLVRGKSGLADKPLNKEPNSSQFYTALTDYFPALHDPPSGTFENVAQVFWQGFRNGILHQATFSTKRITVQKSEQPAAFCSFNLRSGIAIKVSDSKRVIVVDPFAFSKSVVELIEADFESYQKADYTHHDLAFGNESWIGSI